MGNDPWIGTVIDNRYRVIEQIGQGGMGVIYKVQHTQMGKIAALKLLHGAMAADPLLVQRFRREAAAISKLNHPHIVQVFDFGQASGAVYLVMEFLQGEDLGVILRRSGTIDHQHALPILMQVCDALTEAHAMGIIHGDLKPENIYVSRTADGDDFAKVLDFGLAKMIGEDRDSLTAGPEMITGTPYYMAPEVIRAEAVGPPADLYSLGALAYRLLTGEPVFVSKSPIGILTKHISEQPIPPSARNPKAQIPPELDPLLLKALAKDPSARFASAAEFKQALTTAVENILSRTGERVARQRAATPRVAWRRASDITASNWPLLQQEAILGAEESRFVKKLRRGRALKLAAIAALLLGTPTLIYWLSFREGKLVAPSEEREPNNLPTESTLLLPDKPVSGMIGKRVSANESDRDWYALNIDGAGPQVLRAQVSGIANLDQALELYDSLAGRIARVDNMGKGGGERITNVTLLPAKYYLVTREVWLDGVAPTENVTDRYSLLASFAPQDPRDEIEPNDRPEHATRWQLAQPTEERRGFLGTLTDRDFYRLESASGTLSGEVSAIPGFDLIIELSGGGLPEKRRIDEHGIGEAESFSAVELDGRAPITLSISSKPWDKIQPGQNAPAFNSAYALRLRLEKN